MFPLFHLIVLALLRFSLTMNSPTYLRQPLRFDHCIVSHHYILTAAFSSLNFSTHTLASKSYHNGGHIYSKPDTYRNSSQIGVSGTAASNRNSRLRFHSKFDNRDDLTPWLVSSIRFLLTLELACD